MYKYCIPIEKKPETCGECVAIDVRYSVANHETELVGIETRCHSSGERVDNREYPPANCPIVEMPDVEGLMDKIARLERLNAILQKAITKDESEASNG